MEKENTGDDGDGECATCDQLTAAAQWKKFGQLQKRAKKNSRH